MLLIRHYDSYFEGKRRTQKRKKKATKRTTKRQPLAEVNIDSDASLSDTEVQVFDTDTNTIMYQGKMCAVSRFVWFYFINSVTKARDKKEEIHPKEVMMRPNNVL